jgi:phosphopantothenoylcysteine decarboxylase/phosphopantothenate--cysteine ligase
MIPTESGELASGLVGEGRMAEPENIVSFLENNLLSQLPLRNKKILITAGPTYESIDPVRFIGNHSSGKMGFELAKEAAKLGAQVILISGPTYLQLESSSVQLIRVTSAQEMYEAAHTYFAQQDVVIAAAAVSDYKPKEVIDEKIKKKESNLNIELIPTQDILASLGKIKEHQKLIGFALETNNEVENAKSKLERKNLDFIVLNSLQDKGAGFKKDTNKISIISKTETKNFQLKSKSEVAQDILKEVISLFHE